MSEKVTVTIEPGGEGRVDKALARQFPSAGRRELAQLFDDGAVRIRGARAKKGDRVNAGDVIELARPPASGDALRPVADPASGAQLEVLIERPELVVIAKPAGMPSQPLRAGETGTAANAIAARWPECAALELDGYDPRDGGLVHRLDIGTSGALIAARTADAYRALRAAFSAGSVHKSGERPARSAAAGGAELIDKQYLALTVGRPVSRECDAPLAQRGDHVAIDYTDGLSAHTVFAVERANATHALVRCTARTGRMHQVRAHLAHVGSPIAGDTIYGGDAIANHPGFYLHGARIELQFAGEQLVIEAPLPARFTAALTSIGL